MLASNLQAAATRLLLHDLSPAPPAQPHLPPPVRGHLLPRVAKLLAADRLSVSYSSSIGGGSGSGGSSSGGPHSLTRVELHDLTAEGYAGEAGSFLARWAPRLCLVHLVAVGHVAVGHMGTCTMFFAGLQRFLFWPGLAWPGLAWQPNCMLLAHAACAGCMSGRRHISA